MEVINLSDKKTNYTAADIIKLQELINNLNVMSLSTPMTDDEVCELQDIIPDNGPTVEEIVENKSTREFLLQTMADILSPREYRVMILLYGFDDDNRRTLQKVANEYGVTRERIRQIEAKSLRKLKWFLREKKKIKNRGDI